MTAQVCSETDARIVEIARSWIGTPYRHQASCRGAGTDCLGLIRGIWRELYGQEPEVVPAYAEDWSETGMKEGLANACARHLQRVDEPMAGDVLVLRLRDGGVAKHLAVLARAADGRRMLIHAWTGRGVVETGLGPHWERKIVAAFRFPRVE